jgi:hypothetical protein
MRGALIHGVLLAVMLVYGYRTWTRDKTVAPNVGNVVLWDKSEADLVSIEYRSPKKIVKLERKPEGYWWGVDTTIETKLKPAKPDAAAGSAGSAAGSGSAGSAAGSGSAGSGAGSGSAAAPEPATIEEEETGRKVREFPIGETGEKLIKTYTAARALRDLGKPSDAAKKDYKLGTKPANVVTMKDGKDVSTSTVTVTFKDNTSRTFVVGGSVYGGSDKYVVDQASGKAYVLSKDLLSGIEIGQSSLQLTDPRGFDATKIGAVTLEANGKSKSFARITTAGGADGSQQVKTWADPTTKKADQTGANFIDNANNLRPTEYASNLKISDLTPVMKLTYKDERGALLGTLSLFKRDKPGQLMEGQELDPANPPKGETEYYIVTEKTRVPAVVRKDTAQRAENDIDTVFSGKQPEPKSIDPKGNPFGNVPPGHGAAPPSPPPGGMPGAPSGMPAPGGAAPADPHGHGAPPAGGAAPGATKPAAPTTTTPAPTATKPATPTPTKPATDTAKPAAPKPATKPADATKAPTPPVAPAPAQ